ncbi:DNA invertase Pin-like site-specific DNA recombinase [Arthrobacter sp. OAP107]
MAGQRIGYVRVSTLDQNEKRQLDGLVLDRVFTDKASGRDTARPQLAELLGFARDGDTVVVHSMDRLARNLDDLRALVQRLTLKGVRVEFVKEHLLFTGEDSPMANLMLSVMGAFAEFERALIRERQREGIALAKQRGAYKGRKKTLTPERAAELVQRAGHRNSQVRSRRRVRDQTRDGVPVPAAGRTVTGYRPVTFARFEAVGSVARPRRTAFLILSGDQVAGDRCRAVL